MNSLEGGVTNLVKKWNKWIEKHRESINKFHRGELIKGNLPSPQNTGLPISAKDNSIGEGECLYQRKGQLNESTPQVITNKIFPEGIDTHRGSSLHPEDIKSLTRTCHEPNNDIVNSEKEKIIEGTPTHDAVAALAACKELTAYSIGLSNVKLFGIVLDPSSRRNDLPVNGRNIDFLYQIAGSDHNSRTLEMLTNSGILDKDSILEQFDTLNEEVLTKKIINKMITKLKAGVNDESLNMKIESSVHEAFSTLKSDSFIKEWFRSGYSTQEEHRNCISILGSLINFQYSDLSWRTLSSIDFGEVDLTGSSLDNCRFYKCDFRNALLEDVTMYDTECEDCNGYRDADNLVARQLMARGVQGINLSHDFSDVD